MNNKPLHTFIVLAYQQSPYLENCIQSVLDQKYNSKVIIATTTLNNHIKHIAKKYNLDIKKTKHINIGNDFDFAKNSADTTLVTIAHQDDIYDSMYSYEVVQAYNKYPDANIIFSDYYEIRNNIKTSTNTNLKIKKLLLTPLKIKKISNIKLIKRMSIRFGNSIGCPTVTFNNNNTPKKIFESNFKANVDWYAWEKLSKIPGRFVFINKKLMGHRISQDTETSKIINSGIRTKEDLIIYRKFWPKFIANLINKLYRKAEKSNSIENK
ncbi:MAG: hypothetical protein Q4E88_04740 [Coriobacteriia bacterium]|nr:hypothetical protein [Coriobacteriia bacterium]